MKFFINLDKFNFLLNYNILPQNYFDGFHYYFYFCLLPFELKSKLFNYLNEESKNIFFDIFNINIPLYDLSECDCVVDVLPVKETINTSIISSNETIEKQTITFDILQAKSQNKKIILFQNSDDNSFSIPSFFDSDIILFTPSGYKNKKSKNIFGCPTANADYFKDDFLDKQLTVGFCGQVKDYNECFHRFGCNTVEDAEKFYLENPKSDSKLFRYNVVNQLKNYSYFDLIERVFWGGINGYDYISKDKTTPNKFKSEYIDNLKNNLYSLCVRGAGNFSFRLQETFMMGRIPVLIDTECILPFENEIPYKTNTVYVTKENSNNFTEIDKVIQNFHNSHTEKELLNIQLSNRNIWVNYFKMDSSFNKTLDLIQRYEITSCSFFH
jgi:hypothetical protein